ncbi:hypothetical protein JTE90_023722 [Oedothorax gibbosus]|uniref:sn-1-specific diacylglycerol lipase ABHD11 n=1 Tax=Oedothorax gibbosus TaxID=931172 RepID=A0AAV6V9P9_9ARAC|nr:hypothetical protein JTE90_023722 [Oedothorax gibbosus]
MEFNSSLPTDSKNMIAPVKLYSMTYTPDICDETLAPIIFIPGFYSTNRTFAGVRYIISRRTKRRIFVIELRNHGMSEYSDDFSLSHCIADFENFMETSNISRAVLAGHSMGGKLALAMALKHPDKVEKVIVEDVNVVFTELTIEGYSKNLLLMKFLNHKFKELPSDVSESEAQRQLVPHVLKFWPKATQNYSKLKSNSKIPFRVPLYTNASGKVAWEFNGDVVIGTPLDKLNIDLSLNPIYTGDTLLLAGEVSFTGTHKEMDAFYKHFPNLTCEVIPNVFHTYHVECPELYIKLVSKFIGEEKFEFHESGAPL